MSTSTYAMFDYGCHIYQPENCVHEDDEFSTEAVFSIYFFTQNPVMHKRLDILQKHILRVRESISWSTMSRKLSELNVPYHAHPGMIQKIMNCARSAASEDRNIDCQNIPLVVIINSTMNNELTISESVRRSMDEEILNLVPALEKIKVEGSCSKQCVICLEDILVGSKAVRMSCSHIYHGNCIVNWLKQSNLCPLCRFQML